jgi:hypothetical protein
MINKDEWKNEYISEIVYSAFCKQFVYQLFFYPTFTQVTYKHIITINKDDWKNLFILEIVLINNLTIYCIYIHNYFHVFFFFEKK